MRNIIVPTEILPEGQGLALYASVYVTVNSNEKSKKIIMGAISGYFKTLAEICNNPISQSNITADGNIVSGSVEPIPDDPSLGYYQFINTVFPIFI